MPEKMCAGRLIKAPFQREGKKGGRASGTRCSQLTTTTATPPPPKNGKNRTLLAGKNPKTSKEKTRYVQRGTKRYVNLAKQDPGKARQSS